jgi:hypothetical protein
VDPVAPEGWYRVVSIKRDGEAVPPASVDELRWKTISLRDGIAGMRGFDGSIRRFRIAGEPGRTPIMLFELHEPNVPGDSLPIGTLILHELGGGEAALTGDMYGHRVDATLKRQNRRDFPLMSRPFRWIIEEPYFR